MKTKQQLRAEMRKSRHTCTDREVRNRKILDNLLHSALYQNSVDLLCYASFGSEADTYLLIQHALQDGKSVFLPRCMPHSNEMHFFRIFSLADLHPDAFGIPAPEEDPDRIFRSAASAVCLVPGLAFSARGERLGYGKGYYDTFLERTEVCTVGLCYDFQVLPFVPTEPHDKLMQYICTDRGLFPCTSASEPKG